MNALALIFVVGSTISAVSFFAIRYAAHRPANGELHTLLALGDKISETAQNLNRLNHV